jgi:hypothetical protein
MAPDYINIIERELIKQLRTNYDGCHVFPQYPDAVDVAYPALIMELTSSGLFDRFMGEKLTFDGVTKTGELVGLMYIVHLIVDKDAQMSISSGDDAAEPFKQRRLLNFLMLGVANTFTDMGNAGSEWPGTVEVTQQELSNWTDIAYDAEMELWGGSAVYLLVFKNYRD